MDGDKTKHGMGAVIKETESPYYAGKENHLGTQLVDIDGDGDLDVVGIAWDNYKYLHIWRNDGIKKKRK